MSRGQARPFGHHPKGVSLETRVVTAQQALGIITAENAFAKNIATSNPRVEPAFDNPDNGWGFLTRQLQDPEYYRPARAVPAGADRTQCYDPIQDEWSKRAPNPVKGESKPGATFTKKTAVSLLPADGRINLYSQQHGIVMVFDVTKCNVKQYIFDHNVVSNARWWLGLDDENRKGYPPQRSTTLDAIRLQHRNAKMQGVVPNRNEVLPDLCADAVIAVAIPQYDLVRCLNAQYRRLILRRELNIDVPLLIMTTDRAVFEYTKAMQLQDLANARTYPFSSIQRDFYNAITRLEAFPLNGPMPTVAINIFQAIRDCDLCLIELALKKNRDCVKEVTENNTPIQLAASLKYWDCVELIASKVATDSNNDTAEYGFALHSAASENQSTVALALVAAGASVNWVTMADGAFKGYHPIHFAIHYNDRALLEDILIKHQAMTANLTYEEYTSYERCVTDSAGYQRKTVHSTLTFQGITPLFLALNCGNAEFMRLLLKYGAVRIDSQVLSMIGADSRKWNCALAYCDAIFSSGGDSADIVSQLSPIASRQGKTRVFRKLTEMQARLVCRMERGDFEKEESSARRKNLLDAELAEFKSIFTSFCREQSWLFLRNHNQFGGDALSAMSKTSEQCFKIFSEGKRKIEEKEKNETTQAIVALRKELADQLTILKGEIQSKDPAPSTHALFAKIVTLFNASDREKKVAKKLVLEKADKLLGQQLRLGGSVVQQAIADFNAFLSVNEHWNDGKNNRTAPLIERARALIKKPCAKWQEDAAQAAAFI